METKWRNISIRDMDSSMKKVSMRRLYDTMCQSREDSTVDEYELHPDIYGTKITESGDTILHLAISHGDQDDIVLKLIDQIAGKLSPETAKKTLSTENKLGNTLLHCAALGGSKAVCERLVHFDTSLVFERNKEGETPTFSAALSGQKTTFFYLYSVSVSNKDSRFWIRKNGDSVLHCTIEREFLDLSFQITHLPGEHIVHVNENGLTPLDVLATKPSFFKSTTHLPLWAKFLFRFTHVRRLQFENPDHSAHAMDMPRTESQDLHDENKHPQNYRNSKNSLSAAFGVIDHVVPKFSSLIGLMNVRRVKEKLVWGEQIMDELLRQYDLDQEYKYGGVRPVDESHDMEEERNSIVGIKQKDTANTSRKDEGKKKKVKRTTTLLIASKYGVKELVERILRLSPVTNYDTTEEDKNLVHIAVEKRQPQVLTALMDSKSWEALVRAVDDKGNNALHLAAKLSKYKPWAIPASAIQMQWEVKWYQFVKSIVPNHLNYETNKEGYTPADVFTENHKELARESSKWLEDTSMSSSIVAALIAGVTFAAAITVPGGNDGNTGKAKLQTQPGFRTFDNTTYIAFCTSIVSLVMFLSVHNSRKQPEDFHTVLPLRLVLGLSSLFVSIAFVLLAFCAAISVVLDHRFEYAEQPLFSLSVLPLLLYAQAQFPLFWDLLKGILMKVPQPRYQKGEKLYT